MSKSSTRWHKSLLFGQVGGASTGTFMLPFQGAGLIVLHSITQGVAIGLGYIVLSGHIGRRIYCMRVH